MAIPTWSVGQVLTASDVTTWFVPLAVVTTSDQSLTSTTTLTNDNTLSLAVAANSTYEMHSHVVFDGLNTNGAPFNYTGPAGSTASFSIPVNGTGASAAVEVGMNAGIVATFGLATLGAGTNITADIFGTVVIAGTAGTLQFQWAQTNSSGTATRRRARSYLVLRRIA